MNAILEKITFLVLSLAGMLSFPALLNAENFISLDEHEKKLVSQGEIIVREIDAGDRNGRTFEAIGLINAPRKNVLTVLEDYKKYPEFMPNVSRVDIVEQSGNEAVLNYTLTLPLGKIKKYRLRISADTTDQLSVIAWQLLEWPELKTQETITDTNGYWRIDGKDEKTSLVLYHVYTDPGPIPLGLGWIVDVLSKHSVPECFLQTKLRAEKLSRLHTLNAETADKR